MSPFCGIWLSCGKLLRFNQSKFYPFVIHLISFVWYVDGIEQMWFCYYLIVIICEVDIFKKIIVIFTLYAFLTNQWLSGAPREETKDPWPPPREKEEYRHISHVFTWSKLVFLCVCVYLCKKLIWFYVEFKHFPSGLIFMAFWAFYLL